MTRLLAIETATLEVGVSLVSDTAGVLSTTALRPGRRQVETLHPAIESVLGRAQVSPADLDAIAVDIGPGLFTGLRVGVAAAKALAGALAVPIVTATSLEILRRAAAGRHVGALVVPVVDMRRGELAFVLPGEPEPELGTPADLVAGLERSPSVAPVVLVGDGACRFREELSEALAALQRGVAIAGPDDPDAPPVEVLALIGLERLASGGGMDAADVRPKYLRGADARINWETRLGRETA